MYDTAIKILAFSAAGTLGAVAFVFFFTLTFLILSGFGFVSI